MILLIDLAYEKDSLSFYEFVKPIAYSVKQTNCSYECIHFSEISSLDVSKYEKIILCGTALKDNEFANHMDSFSWLTSYDKPVLGICAGFQVIASVFGGTIIPQPDIGLLTISIVKESYLLGQPREISGYHLHNFGISLPDGFDVLAGSIDKVEAFKHRQKNIYGILFHPEVRNLWVIDNFVLHKL